MSPPSKDMERYSIVVVEDEPAIAESIAYSLRKESFETTIACTLAEGLSQRAKADLFVLDLMLPDGSGFDLIARLRAEGSPTPIIVLSSRDSEADRVACLETGADDYVTKPFSPREIVARVRAVLRRFEGSQPAAARRAASPLSVDHSTRRARYATAKQATELELTRVEFDLLAQLAHTPGRVFARAELIDRVWGDGFAITDRTIDSHIKSLRRKVADAGGPANLIETVRGVGYRLSDG